MQIRIGSARQSRVVPVTTPFEDVSVRIVEAPGVRLVAADRSRALQRRPRCAAVVRPALEVGLAAAKSVPERSSRGRAGAAGVLPLGFGRQPKLPVGRQAPGSSSLLGKASTETL